MSASLPLLGEVRGQAPRTISPLAAKGFRPFFASAAIFAACILPVWLLVLFGMLPAAGYLDATSWHAHEMVFGFAVAVIAGFLLTAVGNWTQKETLIGAPLLAACALWWLGRVTVTLAPHLPRGVPLIVDAAFLPAIMVAIGRPLVQTGNRRNFVMLGVLGALAAANVSVHLGALGVVSASWQRRGSLVGLDVVLLVVLVLSGRVFPMFTKNATGVASIRAIPKLDVATVVAMALLGVVDALAWDDRFVTAMCAVTGLLAVARAWHWGSRHAFRHPLLWILHVGYAWIPLGLGLRAVASATSEVPAASAAHALTVGAIGSLTLGMMARVSLGHTGRPLTAPRPVVVAFALMTLAAVVRVMLPLAWPAAYRGSLIASGALWTAAFALFVVAYAPMFFSPRVDGKAG